MGKGYKARNVFDDYAARLYVFGDPEYFAV